MASQMLAFGVATAMADDNPRLLESKLKELFMVQHIDEVCNTRLHPHEVLYVGDHNGEAWFYTPFNADCQYTGQYTNVWSMPAKDVK